MTNNLSAFILFALVAAFTPGPNNLMLATSGVNFGLRRMLPHMLGVIVGFPLLFASVGTGLGELFRNFPVLHTGLKLAGSVYLAWLAWKIAFAQAQSGEGQKASPLSFWQAVAFQWVNPKAWVMVVSAITLYTVAGVTYA